MNIEQFEDLVDRFGERPADWPDDRRAAASQFLAGSREAQDFVAEATALRNRFDSDVAKRAPIELSGKIVALAGRMEGWRPSFGAKGNNNAAVAVPKTSPLFNGSRLPRSYIWLVCCFVAGLGLGLGLGLIPVITDGHIDFATLFAVVGS